MFIAKNAQRFSHYVQETTEHGFTLTLFSFDMVYS